jgi:hypothetical protein
MKKIFIFLLVLIPAFAFAQYPATGNKMRLGWQTTADGLIYRGGTTPSTLPSNLNNAYFWMDTVGYRLLMYNSGIWYVIADTISDVGATNLSFTPGSGTIPLNSSTGTDVRFKAGTNITLTAAGDSMIINSSAGTAILNGEVKGDVSDTRVDTVQRIVFDQTHNLPDSVAKLAYNSADYTLHLGMGLGNTVYQLGQELFYPPVINGDSVTIQAGQPLMVDPTGIVQGDKIKVVRARWDIGLSQLLVGVAAHDIAPNNEGLVTWFGYVREVNHADVAQTGVTLDVGDILYLSGSESGKYTDVEPARPKINSTMAVVVRKPTANNMTLLVRPWLNEKLADLQDVDAKNPANGSVLVYNDTTDVWQASQVDRSVTNEGILGVGAGGANTSIITSNTSGANGVTASGGTGIKITETTSTNGGTISFAVDTTVIATVSAVRDTATVLRSLIGSSNLKGGGLAGTVTYWSALDTLTFDSSFTYNASQDILGLPTLGRYQIGGTTIARLQSNNSLFYGTGGDSVSGAFNNLAVGIDALKSLTSGDFNVSTGYESMAFATTAFENTAYGYQSLYDCTSCSYNTSLGHQSLYNNINGQSNIAIGYQSLYTSDSTSQNIAIGTYSLYYAKASRNVAIGHEALGFNSSGGDNSALGYRSLYRNTTGFQNVAIGKDAGTLWQTGFPFGFNTNSTNSVFIGVNSRAGAASQNNEIVIGATAIGNGSNTATIGNDSIVATYLKGQLRMPMYGDTIYTGTAVKYLAVTDNGDVIEVDAPAPGGSGTVTSITAGYGLTGGTITTVGTIAADTAVLASKTWVSTRGYLTSEVDGNVANEGLLSVGAGEINTATISSNTSGSQPITINGGTNITINEVPSSNGGIITISATVPSSGGGGTVDGSGLANKVAYWSNDSTITYDNNFHYDPINDRLGLATSAPSERLEANGNIRASLGKVLVNTHGSQVIHVSNNYAGDSGGQNVWIGNGGNNDLGNDESIGNTAVGVDAMLNYGSGSSNAAFGWGALKGSANWGGFRTTAIGSLSQELTGSTQDNTSIGYHSLRGTSGNANTALGSFALAGQNTGDYNIALGFRAGVATTGTDTTLNTSRNSIFIGGFTKADDESSVNEIVIGHQATGDGSNTTVIGNDSITSTKLKGQLKLPMYATNDYSGAVSKYLAVDASGNVIEADGTSGGGGGVGGTGLTNKVAYWSNDSTLTYDTNLHYDPTNDRLGIQNATPGFPLTVNGKIGVDTMQVVYSPGNSFPGTLIFGNAGATMVNTKGGDNTIVGNAAAYNLTNGAQNTIMGRQAAQSITSGEGNSAFGWRAANKITTSSNNDAFGYSALGNTTSGSYNSAFGSYTLNSNTTGANNSAFGNSALSSNTASDNTAVGSSSLLFNTSGTRNTAVGGLSLLNMNSGSDNVGLGYDAGRFITSGSNNTTGTKAVLIGAGARASANGNSNEIAIGYAVRGNGSNTVTIGNDTITATHLKGQLKLPQYATNNFSGTPSKYLAVDASGNVIETDGTAGGGGTGTVKGTGAANKVAIWASADSLYQNTNFHWDNTNIGLGIGTNSYYGRLSIMSDASAFGYTQLGRAVDNISVLRFLDNAATVEYAKFDVRSDAFFINAVANMPMMFLTNNTEKMRITATGNVGIGTNNPAVYSNYTTLQIGSNNTNQGLLLLSNGTTNYWNYVAGNEAYTGTSSNHPYIIQTNNAERMRITADGNVGIGTSSPGFTLDVNGGIRSQGWGNANAGSITFGASATPASIYGDASIMALYTANTERLRITAVGNVGIGTTTPAERLHVSGNIRMTGNLQRAAPVTVAASTHTLAETTSWLIVNNAGTCTVTLPAASTWTGRELTIKTITANAVISASSNVVPIDGDTAGTAILPATDGAWAKLVSDGTNWIIMQRG